MENTAIPMTEPTKYTRANQDTLLAAGLVLTKSEGWAPDAKAIGVLKGDRLIAVMVMQKATTLGAEIHFGGETGWASSQILKTLFKVAFEYRRYPQLIFPIAITNVPVQIIALKSGALISGVVGAGVMMQEPAITMSMTRNMCRWLEPSPINDQRDENRSPV
jgi:hypothetical protein